MPRVDPAWLLHAIPLDRPRTRLAAHRHRWRMTA